MRNRLPYGRDSVRAGILILVLMLTTGASAAPDSLPRELEGVGGPRRASGLVVVPHACYLAKRLVRSNDARSPLTQCEARCTLWP